MPATATGSTATGAGKRLPRAFALYVALALERQSSGALEAVVDVELEPRQPAAEEGAGGSQTRTVTATMEL
jgi:hypothetical protein